MVGVAIGMIGMTVMMQVLMISDASKRTTAGGGEAQINGAAALNALAVGVRQSGYGMTSLNLIGCDLTLRAAVTLKVLAPVSINHADIPRGDAGSDTLLIAYGNADGSPDGDLVILQPDANTYAVTTPLSFNPGNWIVAQFPARAEPCNLSMQQVITRTASPAYVTVAAGVPGMDNGTLFNLGPAPQFLAYAVRGSNLTVCDYLRDDCSNASLTDSDAVWTPVATGIVMLRAQVGRDATPGNMDAIVDVFDQEAPLTTASAGAMTLRCAVSRILAVRLALVARSSSVQKTDVTTSPLAWSGSAGAAIDLSSNADWQRYRYKLFETLVPLRNLVALGAQSKC
jgi:type IV pilus assembly protein PilW